MSRPLAVWGCLYLFSLSALAAACSDSTSGPTLPHLNDLTSAPAKIQIAANAVVRVHTAGAYGTGSFISPSGSLLTNNHVLGDTVCPIEGCYLEITSQHQRGKAQQKSVTVFGVPVAVDVGLDMAVVQLYDSKGGAVLATPDYLQVNPLTAAQLLGQHVTIVGHPEGALKKWSDGSVADTSGKWFTSTVYTLPGHSGSPVLDDDGQIVGLLHRGPTSEDLFSHAGVNMYSVGTASADLSAAMSSPLPSAMLSLTANITADALVDNDLVYLNARAKTVTMGGTSTPIVPVLGTSCDAVLARTDFASPNDLSSALKPCYDAHVWIDCQTDASSKSYGTTCPDSTDLPKWVSRNQAINQAWLAMNGQFDYAAVSFSIAALQSTMTAGVAAGAQSLQQALDTVGPPLDITLGYYLAAFNVGSYGATDIHSYFVNYTQIPHYELNAKYVAYAATWLAGNRQMTKAELTSFLKKLLGDPKVSLGDQLAIEDYLYSMDAL